MPVRCEVKINQTAGCHIFVCVSIPDHPTPNTDTEVPSPSPYPSLSHAKHLPLPLASYIYLERNSNRPTSQTTPPHTHILPKHLHPPQQPHIRTHRRHTPPRTQRLFNHKPHFFFSR
jgi:hypothetical protein